MRMFTHKEVINSYRSKGYPLNERIGGINLFGVRNSDPLSNTFDDKVGILTRITPNTWNVMQYDATTDPGLYYRENPMNKDGTAIIVPGFHKDCYKLGKHTGYKAIEQIAPMIYVRDNNKNKVLDFLYKLTGHKRFNQVGKTNIHKAGKASKLVDKWSAGCQVLANERDFDELIHYVERRIICGEPNLFSYALFQIEDFN